VKTRLEVANSKRYFTEKLSTREPHDDFSFRVSWDSVGKFRSICLVMQSEVSQGQIPNSAVVSIRFLFFDPGSWAKFWVETTSEFLSQQKPSFITSHQICFHCSFDIVTSSEKVSQQQK